MLRFRIPLALYFLASSSAFAQLPVSQIHVEGNTRLPLAGIVAASGLRIGSVIEKKQIAEATQRIFDTGLFTGVNFRYETRPGATPPSYFVTFMVVEDRARTDVLLDIPGFPEDQLWAELKRTEPLVDKVIPDSDAAAAYYSRAIERVLAKANHPAAIVAKNEADLATRKSFTVFQPASLPKVVAIR